ncbi:MULTISPECIES: AzlC family ABC transporter permease [unclassified Afipia]|uniref:AzlC family ABC transporter permease n=1 Tax=unclassified Afipia TaxID=2642050 RepID=UPI0003FFD9F2|nr:MULTISPECIES: AzlC family ABC transporter permease [unclassified Afipia]
MALPVLDSPKWQSAPAAFALGVKSALSSILALVLFGTFIGVGAFAHDTGFTLGWALASTVLVWAGPAQIILISTFHAGATVLESALAVTISAIRLLPMVVSVLPMLRSPETKMRQLALPAHFVAVTVWVESFRLLPQVPRERRIAFLNGLGSGLVFLSSVATAIGYGLAANLPPLLAAGILALTPLTFLLSTARNAHRLVDKLALALGLALYPLVQLLQTGVDIMICGLTAGTIAYGVDRIRRRA